MPTKELQVEGMTWGHCVQTVTWALQQVEGVRSAQVDLNTGRARVGYDETRTGPQELVGALSEEGYSAALVS